MKILLAVTGSIACYKSYDLLRELIRSEHQVRIVLTKGAEQFLKPELFFHLGAQKVYRSHDDFSVEQTSTHERVLHIELVNWCDRIVIAPLSANTLAKLACGMADDLITSVTLAREQKPLLLFPAMNTRMWQAKVTQDNVKRLSSFGASFVSPSEGQLACGDVGEGKLPPIRQIAHLVETLCFTENHKKALVTTGATIASLDPVRYLTNASSGLTGFELAKQLLQRGFEVHVLAGPHSTDLLEDLLPHPQYQLSRLGTTAEMLHKVDTLMNWYDLYVSAAAISDIEFPVQSEKIKKSLLQHTLSIKKAPDVLAHVLSHKKAHQRVISFAAETAVDQATFLEKFNRKPVDLMVGNQVNHGLTEGEAQGFATSSGSYYFITKKNIQNIGVINKRELASKLVHQAEGLLQS